MYDRKVPINGSYLFKLITTTSAAHVPDERLETGKLATHDVMKLRQKENWGVVPDAPEINIPREKSDGSEEPDYVPPSDQPTWDIKLKKKMRKLFCIQVDTQKNMYKAHVAEKIARQCQVTMIIGSLRLRCRVSLRRR